MDFAEWKKKKEKDTITFAEWRSQQNNADSKQQLTESDIAPVKQTNKETEERTWFQKGAFEDGYQFGDVLKTISGTSSDLRAGLMSGILGMGETVVDTGAYIAGGVGGLFGADEFQDNMQEFIAKDLYDERAVAEKIVKGTSPLTGSFGDIDNSVLGEKSDSLVESGGQLLGQIALAPYVPWFVTSAVTSFGGEVENAFNQGASYRDAGFSGVVTAGAELLTEKLFGGSGLGEKGLINTELFTKGIANKTVKLFADYGIDIVGEGLEEVASEFLSTLGTQLSYERKETLGELLTNEEAFDAYAGQVLNNLFGKEARDAYKEAFIGGAVLGGVANVGKVASSAKTGRDYRTELTENEQKVFDKVYEDAIAKAEEGGKELTKKQKAELYDNVKKALERGEISTDTIEAALGGEAYDAYKKTVDVADSFKQKKEALQKEFDELNKMKVGERTGEQTDRLEDLRGQIKDIDKRMNRYNRNHGQEKDILKSKLSEEVQKQLIHTDENGKAKYADNYLIESYNESARGSQKYESDLSKYSEKQQKIIKKAMDSGILNNRRKTHDLVDLIAKVYEDKGVDFDFLTNEKLKGSSYSVEGAMVNGYYDKKTNTIGVNINSPKYLNTVVGHEVTHVLEGTETYNELQKAVFEYAKSKGELDSRRKNLEKLYSEEDIDSELTADLVGDYLFQDADFIKNLSVKNRNLFQKIFDEIKYLCKVATAGSKEARELEMVKKLFAEVYRESDAKQKSTAEDSGVKHSIVALDDGKVYVDASRNIIKGETVDEMRSDITRFFSDLLGDNSSLDIHTIEGDTLTITKGETADKARDNYQTVDGQRVKMTDEEFAVKMHIEAHIDEIAEVSKPNGGKDDSKNHSFAKDGFTYRRAYFKDFDGQYYEVTLSIGNKGTVATVYNVGKIKEGVPPSAKILAVVGSKPLGNTPSAPIIPQNSKKSSSSAKKSLSSIANTFFGDENMSAYTFQQADYKQTQGYKDYVEQCVNNYRQTRVDFDEATTRKEIEDSIDGIIQVAIASKKAGYDIYDDATKRNKKDSKNRLLFSSLEPNSDYFTSSDISTICDKRQNFAEIYDDIVRAEEAKGVPKGKRFFDNVDNYFYLHKLMADKGLTQPCRQCYVESMRKNLAPMANAFIRLVGETDPNNTANDQLYEQKGKKKGEMKSNNAATREWVREKLAEYDMTAESLTVEMLTTEDGLAQLKIQAPLIYEAFNSFYGQSKPKMPKSATPFRFGELTALLTDNKGKIKQSLVNKINSTGGFRLQSYSDFQIQNYTDVLQVIFEAGTLGLNGHAYTKVPAFLDATEGTNLKRNISIFMYKDGNEWKLDRNDSFPYSLDEIYDIINSDETGNTSIIAVSQNNEMSAWIMANDKVGYGIPFHKSGMKMGTVRETIVKEGGREIKGYSETKDHTKQQTEVWAKTTDDHKAFTKVKNGINIYSFWDFNNADGLSKNELIEKNIKAYIDACEEAGYIPKFRDYVMNNGKVLNDVLRYSKELGTVPYNATIEDISFEYKGYTIPYGYYKFLGDFGMFTPDGNASPQQALSLKNYDFAKAVEFFADSETLRRNEVLQQFSNGEERQRYRDSDLTAEQLMEIVKQKRGEIAQNVVDGKRSLSMDGEVPVKYGNFNVSGDDVRLQEAPTQENIAPIQEDIAKTATTTPTMDAEEEVEEIAPVANTEESSEVPTSDNDAEHPIITVKQRLAEKQRNYQAELDKNKSLREAANANYDKRIAEAQAKYDAIKDKDSKLANDLARRIEKLKRLKKNIDADYAKRINDLESRMSKTEEKLLQNHDKADRLERYRQKANKLLEAEKSALTEEFNKRRETLQKETEDKNAYVSNRAKELYDELSNLKKGVKASKELGYLLDHGFEWNSLKSTLLKVNRWSKDTINPDSVEESTIREMLNEEYDGKLYDLDELDNEYNDEVANLEAEYNKKYEDFKVANQRMTKQQEYSEQMEELVGDTSTWVDKKMGIQYKTNTLRRNLRDIVRDAKGNRDIVKADAIYDELQGKYNLHEADLNRESNKIKNPYAEMKITKAEDAYIQMLGELRHNPDTKLTIDVVKEFYEKNKANIDEKKVDKAIEMARETYDDLLSRVNEVLREQGMKEIPYRKGYFPHFTEDPQKWYHKLFNWKPQNNDIPTDIAGLTEQFNPNRSWQSFNKQRTTDATDYSFTKGLDTYVHGALDWVYHIEDIQKRRALENHIRYTHSDQGVKDKIEAIRKNETYDADEMQEQIDLVYKEKGNPLNNFVTDLRAGTNRLANKKSSMDRGMEEAFNREIYSTMTNISNRVTGNMVAGSISSALTNFIPITQSWAQVSPVSSLRAMGDTIKSIIRDDGMVDKSAFLTNRLRSEEKLNKTTWDKVGDKLGLLMEGIDNFTSQTVWRSKYMENISNGMSEIKAIKDADQFAANVIADRSRGNMPTIFDSKNILWKTLTAFQLEVNNQYGYMFKDLPIDVGSKSKKNLVKGYVGMFLGAYAYNALYSSLTGRDAAFDPIRIIKDLLEDLFGDDEEEEPIENIMGATMNLAENVVEELPFIGGLLGGGRIPISSALPYDGNVMDFLEGTTNAVAGEGVATYTKEWLKVGYYLAMPMGGGQLKKTIEGLSMFSDDHPIAGSYTDSGNLRFPVEDTFGNRVKAALFGQWSSKNARDYFENERSPLNEKQIKEYADVDLPIADYWDYREGLSGLNTLAEKADYINSLDIETWQKNLLLNNIANRKTNIDLSDYKDYSSFEEFDFAKNLPGMYALSKAVAGNFSTFKKYAKDLNNIRTDKDENGKPISGSRKEKVLDYINSLEDTEYGERIILYKAQYKSDNRYNADILEYLNSRNDLTYEERIAILKELGFKISSDGKKASW